MAVLHELDCTRKPPRLNDIEIQKYRAAIDPEWLVAPDRQSISREFERADYTQTLALVNTIASIADDQDHHPDICFGYKVCLVTWSTHSAGGLSLNDFICAARIDHQVRI